MENNGNGGTKRTNPLFDAPLPYKRTRGRQKRDLLPLSDSWEDEPPPSIQTTELSRNKRIRSDYFGMKDDDDCDDEDDDEEDDGNEISTDRSVWGVLLRLKKIGPEEHISVDYSENHSKRKSNPPPVIMREKSDRCSKKTVGVPGDSSDLDYEAFNKKIKREQIERVSKILQPEQVGGPPALPELRPRIVQNVLSERIIALPDGSQKKQFFVKYFFLSFRMCEWVDEEDAKKDEAFLFRKSWYVRKKKYHMLFSEYTGRQGEQLPFPLEYLHPDRIIASAVVPVPLNLLDRYSNRTEVILYLTKWDRLGYMESTWELPEEIEDETLITSFHIREQPVPEVVLQAGRNGQLLPTPLNRGTSEYINQSALPDGLFRGNVLRPYQLDGMNWLIHCWKNHHNTILADEMGLGKTVQALATLQWLHTCEHVNGPFLVMAPLSTLEQWRREAERWTTMNTVLYHGSVKDREVIRSLEWKCSNSDTTPPYKFDILLTCFRTMISDFNVFHSVHWAYLIFDEAHTLKTISCKHRLSLKKLQVDQILLMTGTPIQSQLSQLWLLLNLIDPKKFSKRDRFVDRFKGVSKGDELEKLQQLMRPYILRRLKCDVEQSLPSLDEIVLLLEMPQIQNAFYQSLRQHAKELREKGIKKKGANQALTSIYFSMRSCCNHPCLLKGVMSAFQQKCKTDEEFQELLVKSSAKMMMLDKLLPELKQGGHKVLIFTSIVLTLDIIEGFLSQRGYTYERVDGRMALDQRQTAVDRFTDPRSNTFVLLLGTRCAGHGLNLQTADTVIIHDYDINPQNDMQAMSRCHRIGQFRPVKVYRLVTLHTYEEALYSAILKKRTLERAILNEDNGTFCKPGSDPIVFTPRESESSETGSIMGSDHFSGPNTPSDITPPLFGTYMDEDDQLPGIDSNVIVAKMVLDSTEADSDAFCGSGTTSWYEDDPDWINSILHLTPDPDNPVSEDRSRRGVSSRYYARFDESSLDIPRFEDVFLEDNCDSDDDGLAAESVSTDVQSYRSSFSIEFFWTDDEQKRFRHEFLELGWGRWQDIKEKANLMRWSCSDVKMYGIAFFCKCIQQLKDPQLRMNCMEYITQTRMLELFENEREDVLSSKLYCDAPDIPDLTFEPELSKKDCVKPAALTKGPSREKYAQLMPESIPQLVMYERLMENPHVNDFIKKHAKTILNRLIFIVTVRRVLLLFKREVYLFFKNDLRAKECSAAGPTVWWGQKEDRDALFGFVKYGVARIEEMFDDPELFVYTRKKVKRLNIPSDWHPPKDVVLKRLGFVFHRVFCHIYSLIELRKKASADNPPDISRRDMCRIQSFLSRFGVPSDDPSKSFISWKRFYSFVAVPQYSFEMVKLFTFEMVRRAFKQAHRMAIRDDVDRLHAIIDSMKMEMPDDVSLTLFSTNLLDIHINYLKLKKIPRFLRRVALVRRLAQFLYPLSDSELMDLSERCEDLEELPWWWSPEIDVDIVRASKKHGFGNWRATANDKAFHLKHIALVQHDSEGEEEKESETDFDFTTAAESDSSKRHELGLQSESLVRISMPSIHCIERRMKKLCDAAEVMRFQLQIRSQLSAKNVPRAPRVNKNDKPIFETRFLYRLKVEELLSQIRDCDLVSPVSPSSTEQDQYPSSTASHSEAPSLDSPQPPAVVLSPPSKQSKEGSLSFPASVLMGELDISDDEPSPGVSTTTEIKPENTPAITQKEETVAELSPSNEMKKR